MELKQLIADDDAVSPVIGVILMVAITVILAAVIGTFVLGIGQDQQSTPQAQFDFDFSDNDGELTVGHSGGSTFNLENTGSLEISVAGASAASGAGNNFTWLASAPGNEISAGATYSVYNNSASGFSGGATEVELSGGDLTSGTKTEVVWTAPGGGDSQILADFNVP